MAFDMNLLPPAGTRYFKNGDSKETVYSALEQYVNEVKEEKTMTNKIRRVTCVILALVLLLSANA